MSETADIPFGKHPLAGLAPHDYADTDLIIPHQNGGLRRRPNDDGTETTFYKCACGLYFSTNKEVEDHVGSVIEERIARGFNPLGVSQNLRSCCQGSACRYNVEGLF